MTSASTSPPDRATRSAARTAPARARSGKILAGIHPTDGGHVVVDGQPVSFSSPTEALAAGVGDGPPGARVLREPSVAENLCLGSLPGTGRFVSRARDATARERRCWRRSARRSTSTALVGELTIGQQQMLQIAAAVGRGARIIVFDEPTSSLSQHEAERLYGVIGDLRQRGVTLHLRQPPDGRDLPAVRHRHRPEGWPAREHPTGGRPHRGHPGRGDDRPHPRRVLSQTPARNSR